MTVIIPIAVAMIIPGQDPRAEGYAPGPGPGPGSVPVAC